jgi:hypothetical protein
VEGSWAAVDQLLNELGDVRAGSPLSGQVADLLLAGDLAGQEKPEETFWKGLLATWCLGKGLLALWDGQSTETDTLLGVENGSLPNKGLDTTGTTVDLVEGNLADDLVAMVPENRSMACYERK